MALGCAFIFLLVLMLWRRRARKQRAKQTAAFATQKRLDPQTSWRWRLLRFGEKLFGHRASRRAMATPPPVAIDAVESEAIKLMRIRNAEEARHHGEMEKLQLFGAYEYSVRSSHAGSARSKSSRTPSTLPSLDGRRAREAAAADHVTRSSIYSEMTGVPRNTPEPRQPVGKTLLARYPSAASSAGRSYMYDSARDARLVDVDVPPPMPVGPSEAQAYADAVRPALASSPPVRGAYWMQAIATTTTTGAPAGWLEPSRTGTSSNNPFRR